MRGGGIESSVRKRFGAGVGFVLASAPGLVASDDDEEAEDTESTRGRSIAGDQGVSNLAGKPANKAGLYRFPSALITPSHPVSSRHLCFCISTRVVFVFYSGEYGGAKKRGSEGAKQ
jgi:hypothetical protein